VTNPAVPAVQAARVDDESAAGQPGFLVRYQLLITGLVMLATALGMLAAISIQRVLERRTEIKAIGAALRGELMAARAVCLGRLKTTGEQEGQDVSWPRIRSTLYQAYVGRLGWLGAELARRVASIYGQASDYASYYDNPADETRPVTVPKRQALQTLIHHIEEVLPYLAVIEHNGRADGIEIVPSRPTGYEYMSEHAAAAHGHPNHGGPRLWSALHNVLHTSGKTSETAVPADPAAEYTAMIEEEMAQFSYDEGEEAGQEHHPLPKLHGTGR
jgi:hypothetical protein